jgi:aryl sulfotransferase
VGAICHGRWRDVLSAEELKLYDAAALRELTPECRRWLENGGTV